MLIRPSSSMNFYKINVANSSFHLVTYNDSTLKVCILSRYTLVATNLTKAVLFEVGLSSVLGREVLLLFKVNFLSSNKAKVSKFATLS